MKSSSYMALFVLFLMGCAAPPPDRPDIPVSSVSSWRYNPKTETLVLHVVPDAKKLPSLPPELDYDLTGTAMRSQNSILISAQGVQRSVLTATDGVVSLNLTVENVPPGKYQLIDKMNGNTLSQIETSDSAGKLIDLEGWDS